MAKEKFLPGSIFSVFLILLLSGALLLAGLTEAAEKSAPKAQTKAASKEPQRQYGGILKIIETSGPTTPFGWPAETVGEASVSAKPVLESLMRQHFDGRFEPVLATAWKVAPDKSSITFTLRKGDKFHDGTDFNAEAVKWNLEQRKVAGLGGSESWSSVEAVDTYTVRVNL